MQRSWLPSKQLGAAALLIAWVAACSYDFDQFAKTQSSANASGAGGSGAGGSGDTGGGGGATSDSSGDATAGSGGAMSSGSAGASSTTETGGAGGVGAGGTGDVDAGPGGADAGGPDASPGSDAGDASVDGRLEGGASVDASDAGPSDAIADASPDGGDAGFDCASLQGLIYQGHCYFPILGPFSWNLAATSCPNGAHLVTITSAAEQAIVTQLLPNRDRWIGMKKDSNTPDVEASFYWVTAETFVPPTSYANWDLRDGGIQREPNFTGDCVRMQFNSRWADDVCTNAYPAICERE